MAGTVPLPTEEICRQNQVLGGTKGLDSDDFDWAKYEADRVIRLRSSPALKHFPG